MGDGIKMALDIGAMPHGNWSGAHAVGWDRNAPDFGDLKVGDGFQKHSYPFGIMVNATGERFVDEGADFRNYTYAKYGHAVLAQPEQFAWQVFDGKVLNLLRDEYRIREVTKVQANTLEELAGTAGRRRRRAVPDDRPRVQRRRPDRCPVQPDRQGWPRDDRPGDSEVELGQHARHAAVRGVPDDLRDHLHLRRPQHQHQTPRCWTPAARRSPASTQPVSWSAGCSTSTTPAGPA